jgi:hypothetical protein
MPTIRFSTNVPQELRLRYLDGKPVESQFGGMQHMFRRALKTGVLAQRNGERVKRPASVPQALPPLRVEIWGTNTGTSPLTPHSTLWSAFAAIDAPLFPSIAFVVV